MHTHSHIDTCVDKCRAHNCSSQPSSPTLNVFIKLPIYINESVVIHHAYYYGCLAWVYHAILRALDHVVFFSVCLDVIILERFSSTSIKTYILQHTERVKSNRMGWDGMENGMNWVNRVYVCVFIENKTTPHSSYSTQQTKM